MQKSLGSVLFVAFFLISGASFAADAPGTEDHPLISRYPGAEIRWQDVQAYQDYRLAVGPQTGYRKIDDWVETAGRMTRTYYEITGEKTSSELYQNYRNALDDAGFEIIAQGMRDDSRPSQEIGGRTWMGTYYRSNAITARGGEVRLLNGSATSGGSGFVAGKLERAEGTVYVAVAVTQYSKDVVTALVDVIEEETLKDDLIAVDADAMSNGIDVYGKIALYGIFFDHDKATIKPESKAALDEIAKLLQARPKLALFVVGHTDMTGSLDYNVTLSKARAESVVKALVDDYGIARSRLTAHGVGPLAPVFTNGSEPGRAKNRRVELVER